MVIMTVNVVATLVIDARKSFKTGGVQLVELWWAEETFNVFPWFLDNYFYNELSGSCSLSLPKFTQEVCSNITEDAYNMVITDLKAFAIK
jgi:hypothetical protein